MQSAASFRLLTTIVLASALVSCKRAAKTGSPAPSAQPLASYLSQRLVVTPVSRARADTMGWAQRLGGARGLGRSLDSAIAKAFTDRAIGGDWFMPPALERAYAANRSYVSDPYNLATDPLRVSTFVALSRYGEPLASQLRTTIALHESARYVLIPVDVRFERTPQGAQAAIRLVVLDARAAEARFAAEVRGNPAAAPAAALADLANRIADLFIAP